MVEMREFHLTQTAQMTLKDRHDYRQQQPTSGCQVALETDEHRDRKLENRKEEEARYSTFL